MSGTSKADESSVRLTLLRVTVPSQKTGAPLWPADLNRDHKASRRGWLLRRTAGSRRVFGAAVGCGRWIRRLRLAELKSLNLRNKVVHHVSGPIQAGGSEAPAGRGR